MSAILGGDSTTGMLLQFSDQSTQRFDLLFFSSTLVLVQHLRRLAFSKIRRYIVRSTPHHCSCVTARACISVQQSTLLQLQSCSAPEALPVNRCRMLLGQGSLKLIQRRSLLYAAKPAGPDFGFNVNHVRSMAFLLDLNSCRCIGMSVSPDRVLSAALAG